MRRSSIPILTSIVALLLIMAGSAAAEQRDVLRLAAPIRLQPARQALTLREAHSLVRRYLASPAVSGVRFLRCKRRTWQRSRTVLCHVAWRQTGVFIENDHPVLADVDP
jgi:hypothetical protein